jgi:hypothetical protein
MNWMPVWIKPGTKLLRQNNKTPVYLSSLSAVVRATNNRENTSNRPFQKPETSTNINSQN